MKSGTPMNDGLAKSLLGFLRKSLDAPFLEFEGTPTFLSKGAEADIYAISLSDPHGETEWGSVPLVCRLAIRSEGITGRDVTQDDHRIRRMVAFQNAVAALGYPAPRVVAAGTRHDGLKVPFLVMERLKGRMAAVYLGWTILLWIGAVLVGCFSPAPLLTTLVFTVAGSIGILVTLGYSARALVRLHRLTAAPLLERLKGQGFSSEEIEFGLSNLEVLGRQIEQSGAGKLAPGLEWLRAHMPPTGEGKVICHVDHHCGNVMLSNWGISGLIDWNEAIVADPEYDIAWNRVVNLVVRLLIPHGNPVVRLVLPMLICLSRLTHRLQECLYRASSGLEPEKVRYYTAFHALRTLATLAEHEHRGLPATLMPSSAHARRGLRRRIRRATGLAIADGYLTIDPLAAEHFLNAMSGKGGDWTVSEPLLREAVEADANFTEAYRMLATSYRERLGGEMPIREAASAAHAAIGRAMALEPDAPRILLTQGSICLTLDLDYARAEALLEKALQESPGLDWCDLLLAQIALREGRDREALMRLGSVSDSASGGDPGFLDTYAWLLFVAREYDRSLQIYVQASGLTKDAQARARNLRGRIAAHICLGKTEEAAPLLSKAWGLDGGVTPEAYIWPLATIGERERAERLLADSQDKHRQIPANGHLALGDIDNTFKTIRDAIEDQDELVLDGLRTAEAWDDIRDDPRFDDMLELLGSKETHTEKYLRDTTT